MKAETSISLLFDTPRAFPQYQIKIKLNRVIFPRERCPSSFCRLKFSWAVNRDSGNLVNPFMRLTN